MIDGHAQTVPMIIFAIDYPAGIPADTQEGWFEGWCGDRNIPFKRLMGVWEGKPEVSYLMSADMEERIRRTWAKDQEAILYLTAKAGAHRQAWLHWKDGRNEAIGEWQLASEKFAKSRSGYTYDPLTGQYWVAA